MCVLDFGPGTCCFDLGLRRGCAGTVTVKPPKGVRSAGNLAGCGGRSRLQNGHESFRFVRNGLESFLYRHQAYNCERHGTRHAKEMVGREGRQTNFFRVVEMDRLPGA